MRIIGDIPHSRYKITLLEMSNKISIQIEDGLLMQTYRFRDGMGIKSVNDAIAFCDSSFLSKVENAFELMASSQLESLEQLHASEFGDLPEII